MNETTFAFRELKPPPALPIPCLRRPYVNGLTKLASLKWIRSFFSLLVNVNVLFFIKTKGEKLSVFVCFFVFYLLKKWKNCSQHLSFFSFFLLKWNYGKLGDRYAIFLFFHFLNKMEKNEKNGANKYDFFIFLFFYFLGKTEKWKNDLGLGDYFIFLTFLTISRK